MRILLLNPPRYEGKSVIREERCEMVEKHSVLPPYSLMQIAAILREKGHVVVLIDANGFDIPYENIDMKNFELLVFRFTPFTIDHDISAATKFKNMNPKGKTVGICYALKMLPNLVLEKYSDIDMFVNGEYINVIPDIVDSNLDPKQVQGITFRRNKKIIVSESKKIEFDWDKLPIPAYDLLPSLNPYYTNVPHGKPFTIMYSSKGCPFSCKYCTSAKTKIFKRSAESIVQELKYLKEKFKINLVMFFDETFTIDRDRVLTICDELKRLKIKWYCNSRTNLLDYELLKVMKKSGCRGLSLGIESGSQKILDSANKGTTVEQNMKALEDCYKVGIKVHCSFIVGLPGESKETFAETIAFLKKTLPSSMEINIFFPYPGTEFFNLVKDKAIDEKKAMWDIINHKKFIPFTVFSELELKEMCKKAYFTIYKNPIWFIKNVLLVLRNPHDIVPGILYTFKSIRKYFFESSEDARW
ncbi:MAG: radical SAM protein [archaeon]